MLVKMQLFNYLVIFLSLIALVFHGSNAILVNTTSGNVRGNTLSVLNRTVNEFLGIPYAEPPVGDLRFGRPQPITRPLTVSVDE